MQRNRGRVVGLLVLLMCLWGLCTASEAHRLQSEFRAETGHSPEMGQVIDAHRVSIVEKMRKKESTG